MSRKSSTSPKSRKSLGALAVLLLLPGVATPLGRADAGPAGPQDGNHHDHHRGITFATYNASLNRGAEGELVADLSTPDDAQAQQVAEVVQRTAPDVLLVNEFDHDEQGRAVDLFRENYLEVSQHGAAPIDYPYAYSAPVNTGVPSGLDLDNSGTVGGPGDAWGFGFFPGQYGMVVYSRHPIDTGSVRTFQEFRWADMPGARLPDDPSTPEPRDWYSAQELRQVRLSSKSHWDVPVRVGGRTVHLLVSHPTPPVFDGPEDRNGTRNVDEIRFWDDYVTGGRAASYVYDDEGRRGGLRGGAFVIAGDQNSDPFDGDSIPGAAQQLLDNPRVRARPVPTSEGAVAASQAQPGNEGHRSPAAQDTADFSEPPGNLRVDYVLPSRSLPIRSGGVFWPAPGSPYADLVSASDHRLVWVEVRLRRR